MALESGKRRLVAAACCGLVAIPFLSVEFPPVTDLPQHVAQIRLFLEALRDPASGYRIQWFTPYTMAYALLGTSWGVFGPQNAGRMALLVLAVVSTAALHWLAARRNRPVAAAVLVSVLFFNHVVYWGFLSFAVGWVAFIVWFLITTRPPAQSFSRADALRYCVGALLLYVGHALWFAVGMAWLVLHGLAHRLPLKVMALRCASVFPVLTAAALWYPHLSALGFVSPTVWLVAPTARLSPEWLVDAALGGLHGSAEYIVVGLLAAWAGTAVWQHRASLHTGIDPDLLGAGMLLCLLALLLPDQHMNTIQFAARWLPGGVIMVVLAVPAPRIRPQLQQWTALTLVAVFSLTTAMAWRRFERDELSGLSKVLSELPPAPRVIGLDLVKESDIIKGRPFLQTFAYSQVLKGGKLNMSFAGFAPSLVVFDEMRPAPWTSDLVWFAERVRLEDFQYFDYAIVNGASDIHAQCEDFRLAAMTQSGRWRLYRTAGSER